MKIDPRYLDDLVQDEENGNSNSHVKNKKRNVPNEFRKQDNKKRNKPKHIQKNSFDD